MAREAFITRPLSILLDLVRGGAALVVLLGHMVQMGLYSGPWPFSQHVQHNAVVVFFVLSGLVIAASAMKGGQDLRAYAIARFTRIMPVALFALCLAALSYALASAFGAEPALSPEGYDRPGLAATVMPLFFLSESGAGVGPVWNPPYWSLVYEVWYYALFAAAFFLTGARRVIWIAVLAALAGPRVLLLLPVWLLGVGLARYGHGLVANTRQAWMLAALAGGLFWIAGGTHFLWTPLAAHALGLDPSALRFSGHALTDYVLGLGVALLFVALRPLAARLEPVLERSRKAITGFAGFSFTLYLIHWPILSLLSAFGIGAGDSVTGFAALIGLILAFAWSVARVTEHRSPELRRWMTGALSHQRRNEAVRQPL